MVATAYVIDRIVYLSLYSIATVLYSIQAWSEFGEQALHTPAWTFRWTLHRIGPAAMLCCTLRYVDAYQVFGIYTKSTLLDAWFYWNGTILVFALLLSLGYSMVFSLYTIHGDSVPSSFSKVLASLVLISVTFTNVILIYCVSIGSQARTDLEILGVGCMCSIALVLLVYTFHRLRSTVLRAIRGLPADQGQLLVSAKATYRRLLAYFSSGISLLVFAIFVAFYFGATSVGPQPDHDPEVYTWSTSLTAAILFLASMLLLGYAWLPVRVASAPGKWCGVKLAFRERSRHSERTPAGRGSGGAARGTDAPTPRGASKEKGAPKKTALRAVGDTSTDHLLDGQPSDAMLTTGIPPLHPAPSSSSTTAPFINGSHAQHSPRHHTPDTTQKYSAATNHARVSPSTGTPISTHIGDDQPLNHSVKQSNNSDPNSHITDSERDVSRANQAPPSMSVAAGSVVELHRGIAGVLQHGGNADDAARGYLAPFHHDVADPASVSTSELPSVNVPQSAHPLQPFSEPYDPRAPYRQPTSVDDDPVSEVQLDVAELSDAKQSFNLSSIPSNSSQLPPQLAIHTGVSGGAHTQNSDDTPTSAAHTRHHSATVTQSTVHVHVNN